MTDSEALPMNVAVEKQSMPPLFVLAWNIWSAGGDSVSVEDGAMRIELEPFIRDGALLESENGLRFANGISMMETAAQYVLQREASLLTSAPKACFERLHEIWREEIGKEDMLSGRVLALLHNGGKIDAYSWGKQAVESGVEVFKVLHIMEGAVAQFQDACPESIFQFFAGHYERVKNDLAGGMLYSELQAWFTQHPAIASEVKRLHESCSEESTGSLYACSMHGLILNDFDNGIAQAVTASTSLDLQIARPAVHVLGLVDYDGPLRRSALHEVVELCANITRTPGHPLLGTAVRTLSRFVALDEDVIIGLLDEVGKTSAPEALYSLSEFLWWEEKTFQERDWFRQLVFHLTVAKIEHKGILNNVDMILKGWVNDPLRRQYALEFMNSWISRQSGDAFKESGLESFFSATVHRLAEQPIVLSSILTEWLLHDDSRYPLVAQKLLARLRVEGLGSIELYPAIIDELSQEEIRFLLRRILGYIVGDEVRIELVFSLIRTQNAKDRTFGYIVSVLQDQVGYDYPYQTLEFLSLRQKAEDETEETKALCRQISAELQGRLDELDALPDLKEFHPSSVKMQRFFKERRRQMNEAVEEASKDSIWRQIATHIPLKGGRRTFQAISGRYTDPMEMKGMSHSIALPKSEITDPAGAARERLLFRVTKRFSL